MLGAFWLKVIFLKTIRKDFAEDHKCTVMATRVGLGQQ